MKMTCKLVSLLLALALCMLLVSGAMAEEDLKAKWASLAGRHLTVGTSAVQTGWSMDDGTGKPEGMDVDVMNYICDYYGLDLEWYVAEYQRDFEESLQIQRSRDTGRAFDARSHSHAGSDTSKVFSVGIHGIPERQISSDDI